MAQVHCTTGQDHQEYNWGLVLFSKAGVNSFGFSLISMSTELIFVILLKFKFGMLTDIKQLDLNKRYTYADYLTWQFDEMVELIRGRVFKMSPAPSRAHQKVLGELFLQIGNYLKGKSCQIYVAPFDVRLPLPEHKQTPHKIGTVVQPDLCIICDPTKLDEQGCNGAPDWIIEILSPATSQKDFTEKYDIYQFAGVSEYWVVHPHEATVLIYTLDEQGEYQLRRKTPYLRHEIVAPGVFPELAVDLGLVFGE